MHEAKDLERRIFNCYLLSYIHIYIDDRSDEKGNEIGSAFPFPKKIERLQRARRRCEKFKDRSLACARTCIVISRPICCISFRPVPRGMSTFPSIREGGNQWALVSPPRIHSPNSQNTRLVGQVSYTI